MLSAQGRAEQRPRPALLTQVAVVVTLIVVSTCLTESRLCPGSLDCARAGRHFCPPGGAQCGPCLRHLVENTHGRCIAKGRRTHHGGKKTYPELDEEIDFLSTIISEQRQTKVRPPAPVPAQEVGVVKQTEPSPTHRHTAAQAANQSAPTATSAPPVASNHTADLLTDPVIVAYPLTNHLFVVISSALILTGSMVLVVAGVCWVRLQKGVGLFQKVEYPYGLMKAHSYDNTMPGDKKLAHSAQMYHYQHQKQEMLSLGKHRDEPKVSDSGATSDEETEDGDFTVYECPGLAPTGEMEVKNPLFDDSTLFLQRFPK